jgi:hypothetical protein
LKIPICDEGDFPCYLSSSSSAHGTIGGKALA